MKKNNASDIGVSFWPSLKLQFYFHWSVKVNWFSKRVVVTMSEIKKAQNQSKFKAAYWKGEKKNKNYQIWFILANHISKCLQVLIILLSYKITLCTTLRYWNWPKLSFTQSNSYVFLSTQNSNGQFPVNCRYST